MPERHGEIRHTWLLARRADEPGRLGWDLTGGWSLAPSLANVAVLKSITSGWSTSYTVVPAGHESRRRTDRCRPQTLAITVSANVSRLRTFASSGSVSGPEV